MEKKKEKEKKNTWKKKFYFCTKVILSLACVPFFPPIFCGPSYTLWKKLIQQDNFQIENFFKKVRGVSRLWHLGNCVAFTLPFSTRRRKRRECLLSLYFCLFLKRRWNFCHLFFVGCSLMFYLSWTEKKVIKKLKVTDAA